MRTKNEAGNGSGRVDAPEPVGHGIPTLARALDPIEAGASIRSTLSDRGVTLPPLLDRVEILKIRQGRRCVLRYVFRAEVGTDDSVVLIGKIRTRGVDRRVDRIARNLRSRGFSESGSRRFTVPEPLGWVDDLSLNLQRGHPGHALTRELGEAPGARDCFFEVGAALAELHGAGPPAERSHGAWDELEILVRDLGRVADARPDLRGRIERRLEIARKVVAGLPDRPSCTLHRDFHPDQVLVGREGLVLLDFDLYAQGDAALDVSNFIAHLREYGLRTRGDARAWLGLEHAFVAGYRSVRAGSLDTPTLEAWSYLSQLRHVAISWRIDDRRGQVEAILELCETSEVHSNA